MRSRRGLRGRAVPAVALLATMALLLSGCGRPAYDGEEAYALLIRQCEFGPRPPGSAAHEEMLKWLIEYLKSHSDQVSVQRFSVVSESELVEMANVIAAFNPNARERVLLGAHWDTRPVAERDPDEASRSLPITGANDGASGVAVLLELASVMSEHSPPVGVDLVFFDGEDGGDGGGYDGFCLGSTYFAKSVGFYSPSFAVVVDMVGDSDLSIPMEPNSLAACPEVVERVWDAARATGAPSFTNEQGSSMFDDHIPLIQVGIPSALIIDFQYPYWHTLADTPDKCSPESLREVGEVLIELIYK